MLARSTSSLGALERQCCSCTPSPPLLPRSSWRGLPSTRHNLILAQAARQVVYSVEPEPGPTAFTQPIKQCWMPAAVTFAIATGLTAMVLRSREKKSAYKETFDVGPTPNACVADPAHHQRVLAKARQAAHIGNAVNYNKSGEVVKALLELSKALANNSVCRCPAVVTHTRDQLADLYRLHLKNTEQPPNFGVLLQIQEMLGLSVDEAEKLEVEVLRSPGAFAI